MKSISDIYAKLFSSLGLFVFVLILLIVGQTSYFQEKIRSVQQSDIVLLWVWNFDQSISKPNTDCSILNKNEDLTNLKLLFFN